MNHVGESSADDIARGDSQLPARDERFLKQFRAPARIFHNVEHIETIALGEFEQLVLMSVVRLEQEAYGATIRRDIETRTARRLSISAVYTTLDRLEQKGLLRSWIGEPTSERGGRRRKYFALEAAGARALKTAYRDYMAMATGLERRLKTL